MTSGWANPSILGWLVFGIMTIFFGLLLLPGPYSSGLTVFSGSAHGLVFSAFGIGTMAYGVAVLLALVGLISLFQGHTFWGSVFLGYGAFWGLFGFSSHHGGFAGYGMAAVAFLWLLFTFTFFLSSMKHGWGTFFAFLFLLVAFAVLTVAFWQIGAGTKISSSESWAFGGELIVTGFLWWYGGTAALTNHTYGKKILPT